MIFLTGQNGHYFCTIGQIWHQNQIFLGKMTKKSYTPDFLPSLSAILEKFGSLFLKVPNFLTRLVKLES